jgi:3-methylcrotonyl-CoA carboxylase alpha subunit
MKRVVNGQLTELPDSTAHVEHAGDRLLVRTEDGVETALAVRRGEEVWVSFRGQTSKVEPATRTRAGSAAGSGELRAPMPGMIVDVLVSEGESVEKGQKLVVLEAMKTQQPVVAPFTGVVAKLGVKAGDQVGDGQLLVSVKAPG